MSSEKLTHTPEFSHQTRSALLNELKSASKAGRPRNFDAVVVGGGIVGVGAARELALRGIKTLVVDKSDFASGTSSRSSKLIHGGLRYLEMFDFGLVFEALAERHWLLKTHPHLVQPLEFVLPSYKKAFAPPKARPSALLGLGLWLYDGLSLFRSPFIHGWYRPENMIRHFPGIRTQGLKGGYYYADAMMLDDEMVLECALDTKRHGGELLNYTKVISAKKAEDGSGYDVVLQEQFPQSGEGDRFTVRAKEVLACLGPWTDRLGDSIGGGPARKLKPSKGVHVIVPWDRFPVKSCLVMYAPDGRIVFVIPRKDLGTGAEMVIIGTTDSPERGDLDNIEANAADVTYLLKVLNEYFPQHNLGPNDIVSTYAGVRPLLDEGEESEAKTSREHEIWRNKEGVVFVAGGKYTTFRPMSEEIVDFAFPGSKPIAGKNASKQQLSNPQEYESRFTGERIWGRFTEGWVKWKLQHHCPVNLEDVVFRRLPLWMAGTSVKPGVLDKIADLCTAHFGWTPEERTRQIQQTKTRMQSNMQWRH